MQELNEYAIRNHDLESGKLKIYDVPFLKRDMYAYMYAMYYILSLKKEKKWNFTIEKEKMQHQIDDDIKKCKIICAENEDAYIAEIRLHGLNEVYHFGEISGLLKKIEAEKEPESSEEPKETEKIE